MPTQKINWSNVGRGVAYVMMGFGSVCGISAAYKVEPESQSKYVTVEEFNKHESVDSVNAVNKKEQFEEIKQLLITMNAKMDGAVVDIAVLKSRVEQRNKPGY